jgi:hypothetical protein
LPRQKSDNLSPTPPQPVKNFIMIIKEEITDTKNSVGSGLRGASKMQHSRPYSQENSDSLCREDKHQLSAKGRMVKDLSHAMSLQNQEALESGNTAKSLCLLRTFSRKYRLSKALTLNTTGIKKKSTLVFNPLSFH